MAMSLSCRELGMDCPFETEGETEKSVLESFIGHVQTDHTDDWFEIEEIHQAACAALRQKAA